MRQIGLLFVSRALIRKQRNTALDELHGRENKTVFLDRKHERGFVLRYGGNPTSHTPAHNVPAVAAPFRV